MAGALGLTAMLGTLFYVATYAVLSAMLLLKMRLDVEAFFPSLGAFVADGLFQGLVTYILFATLSYNIVYVF